MRCGETWLRVKCNKMGHMSVSVAMSVLRFPAWNEIFLQLVYFHADDFDFLPGTDCVQGVSWSHALLLFIPLSLLHWLVNECVAIKAARNCCQLQPDIDAPGQKSRRVHTSEHSLFNWRGYQRGRWWEERRVGEWCRGQTGGQGGVLECCLFIEHFVAKRNFWLAFHLSAAIKNDWSVRRFLEMIMGARFGVRSTRFSLRTSPASWGCCH